MPSLRLLARVLIVSMALSAAATAHAAVATIGEISSSDLKTIRTGSSDVQAALSRGEAWQQFTRRHGAWTVLWNEATRTPHRALGRGIALRGFADDAQGVDRAVRGFIAENAALFGGPAPQLENVAMRQVNGTWYARYRQTFGGIPVLFASWEFRVGKNGKLSMFGADRHAPSTARLGAPRVGAAVAREAAKAGLAFDPATDRVTGGDQLYWLPRAAGPSLDYRLVYAVRITTAKPRGNWIALVDAAEGEVLLRYNHVLNASAKGGPVERLASATPVASASRAPGHQVLADITGLVNATVRYNLPWDPYSVWPLPHLRVNIGAQMDTTTAAGIYSVVCTGGATITAQLRGPILRVNRLDVTGQDALFSKGAGCPDNEPINWTSSNSQDSERNAYYHSMRAHDWVMTMDPTYSESDYEMIAYVGSLDDECTAYFDGFSFTYGYFGSQCPYDMANLPDVVYKSYAQRINDDLYFALGAPFGMGNEVLHAGVGDATAALISTSPIIGDGIEGNGTYQRNVDNTRRWPEDRSTDANTCGLILAGAFWDLKEATDSTITSRLLHFARYGLPGEAPPPVLDAGAAMTEYFIEVLVADDNDNDLGNGTPHFAAIVNAFNAHGIGLGNLLSIGHTPYTDQITNGPFPVTATIQYTGPSGGLNSASPRLWFSINGTPWESRAMTPTGNPDEFGAEIPQFALGVVHYYISAAETFGGTKTHPPGGPQNYHVFVVGPASLMLSVNMESSPGWTVTNNFGIGGSGAWERVDPVTDHRSVPEDDHSDPGTMAWITGQAPVDERPGYNDVDEGSTTLTTSTFNATAGGATFPIISYYRWYSNNAGEVPNSVPWKVEISNNNGSSWVTVENTTTTDQSWRRVAFLVNKYVTPTANMRMRFIAIDTTGALVEAGVDDFTMVGFPSPTDVGDAVPTTLSLAAPAPNPFHKTTRLRYTLPSAAPVELTAFDVHGRVVRRLVNGVQAAGAHDVTWDGRDELGRMVASGPYFLRLSQSGRRTTLGVVRIQ